VCQVFDSQDVPLPIPEGGGSSGTTQSILEVPLGGGIADVNVLNLAGTHTYMGDLDFYLDSPAGTQAHLMERACGTDENFDLNLDDEAPPGPWPCPPTGGGTYQPTEPLSKFDGEDSTGTWTLTIVDNADIDTGTLQSWSLEICAEAPECVSPTISLLSDSPVELGQTMHFTAELTGGDPPLTYTWDLDGPGYGAGLDTAMPAFTYTETGEFTVVVTAENTCGADTNEIGVEVTPICTEAIGVDLSVLTAAPIYPGDEVALSADISPDDAAKPYTYTVDFGDGTAPVTTTSNSDPLTLTHSFATTGTFATEVAIWNCAMTEAMTGTATIIVEEKPAETTFYVYLPLVVNNGAR
jgi:subtilisin-like proprotein convertase family protein